MRVDFNKQWKFRVWLFLAILLTALSGGLWLHFRKPPFIELPFTVSPSGFLITEIEIERRMYPTQLVLGWGSPLALCENCLESLPKKKKGETCSKNLDDEVDFLPVYELPALKFGGYKLRKVLTTLDNTPTKGSVGQLKWPLNKVNLLCDLPHLRVYGVNRLKELLRLGVDLKKMSKVKYQISENGLVIPVTTSLGTLNMALGINFNVNVIRASLINGMEEEKRPISSALCIANQDLGEMEFTPWGIPEYFEVDGFLGAAFLENHLVYIDGKEGYLYLGGNQGNLIQKEEIIELPVEFTTSNLPITDITVGGRTYKGMLDLGSVKELELPLHEPPPKQARLIGNDFNRNIWGETASCQVYALPEYQIGRAKIYNPVLTIPEPLRYEAHMTIDAIGEYEGPYATIGVPLLNRTDLYCDFGHSRMWLLDGIDKLNKIKVHLEDYERIPILVKNTEIILQVESELGLVQFLLDTGASVSCIRPDYLESRLMQVDNNGNACYETASWSIDNQNYGPQILYPLEISDGRPYDGIVGMDFLRLHPFYLDYRNQRIYLAKP